MACVEAAGAEIPKLGLGTWQNTGESCTAAVRTALELGYRHVDTAQAYDNEAEVGAGIEAADVDREEVFLTTKVWRSNLREGDLAPSVERSLDALGVASVDLLLAHWPHPRVPVAETIGAMEALREEGLVDHVGVSNYTAGQLESAIAAAEGPIVADQVLYNPYKDQSSLLDVCVDRDVALTAYSPLARGDVLGDEVLAEIGERYGKSGGTGLAPLAPPAGPRRRNPEGHGSRAPRGEPRGVRLLADRRRDGPHPRPPAGARATTEEPDARRDASDATLKTFLRRERPGVGRPRSVRMGKRFNRRAPDHER